MGKWMAAGSPLTTCHFASSVQAFGNYRGAAPNQTITDRDFTGQPQNRAVGLLYYQARYYVPGIGRFASADTIIPDPAQPQTFNRYTYVFNRPLVLNDPSGHCPWCIGAIGGAIVGAAVGYGAQVYQNMQNGQSFTAALTTDIDAGKIVAGAVVGAVVGGTLGAAAPAVFAAAAPTVTSAVTTAATYGTVGLSYAHMAAASRPMAAAVVGGALETAIECTVPGAACGPSDLLVGAATGGLSTPSIRGAAPGTGSAGGPTAARAVTPNQRQAALQANSAGNANGHYACTHCGYQNTNASHFDIDHIVPRSQGGNTTPSNLRVLCQGCNRSAQDGWPPRQGAQWANRYPERDLRNQVD
jgi:RHS repeat-associated protein